MKGDRRNKGIFVGFRFRRDAIKGIRRAERDKALEIEPITVNDVLQRQLNR